MALSKSILEKIKNDKENKKNGVEDNGSSKKTADSQGSKSSSSGSSSSTIRDRVAMDLALKKLGFTHNRESGVLNDSRYANYYKAASSVDQSYLDRFTSDWNSYSSRLKNAYEGLNWKTATAWGLDKSYETDGEDLMFRSAVIRSYLDSRKDDMDEDSYSNLVSELDTIQKTKSEYDSAFSAAKKFYSQWDTEEDYNQYLKDQKDYEDLLNFDLNAGEKEVKDLEAVLAEYDYLVPRQDVANPDSEYNVRLREIRSQYGSKDDIKNLISEKNAYLNRAKHIQEGVTLSGVVTNADFDANNDYVSTKSDSPKWWSRLTSDLGMGYDDLTYEYINGAENGLRSEIKEKADLYSDDGVGGESIYEEKGYDYLHEDEIAIYNYYYSKEGKEAAEKYLDSIQETLNHRKATSMYENMEDKTLLELAFGVAAGLDQFESGVKNLFNTQDDYIPATATQIASGMVREDLADDGPKLPGWMGGASLGQVGYDTITTTANMAPSMLSSIAANMIVPGSGAIVGNTLMFASSAGNAYQEALNLGYDKGQARAYSTLVGASEAGLQYLLGGIGSLGGKASGAALSKMLDGIDNAFARTALKLGGNMLSEGFEEGLQEVLTPLFKNWTLRAGEDINWSEVAYSGLLGALTAGFMEGGTTISGEVNTYKAGKKLQAADISAQRLAEIGKTFSADTVAYQLAGRVNENTGAYTMGRLFNEIGATLSEQNVTEITNALVAKGMDERIAKKNAEALAYVVEGGQLSERQITAIEANDVLAEVARTTLIEANTTWNQRSHGYNEVLKALADEMTSPKASRTKAAQQSEENAPATDKVDAQAESGTEGLSEADSVDISPAKVQSISTIKNGQATIKLEDGSEVDVKKADLDPDDGVRIETIASIEGISATDANFILNTLRDSTNASAQMDSLGAKEAYKYGFYGLSQEHLTKHGVFANSLTDTQRQAIYEIGRNARQHQIENASLKRGTGRQTEIYFDAGSGKVEKFTNSKKMSTMTDKQKAGVQAAMILRKLGIGGDIYFFESYRNSKGQLVYKDKHGNEVKAPNGWYEQDGSIHIDLNAGTKGQGFILFTLAHELTHFIEQWSPQKYKILADFLVENYEKGQSMDKLVRAKQAKLSALRGEKVSYKEAYSEVIADSMEAMLADGNVMEKLIELKAKDNSLFMKMKQFFDNLLTKVRNIYKGQIPDSAEGRAVLEMTESIEKIQQLFADALVDASENFQAAEKNTTQDGGVVSETAVQRSDRIVDQIRNSLQKIMALDSVYTIDAKNATPYTSVWKTDEKSGSAVFKAQGGVANRPGFGRVVLSKRGAVQTVHHGNGPAKQAAFPAIKAVIEQGIEIYRDNNHNDLGYDTITFSAPITFFGKEAPLAVVVKSFESANADKTFYIHEICDAEGNYIQIAEDSSDKKTSSTNFVEPTSTVSAADGISPKTSIRQEGGVVKSESVETLVDSGIAVDSETDAGSIFSVRDVLDDTGREKVAAALVDRFGVTKEEAKKWLTAETSLASLILNPKYSSYLDYAADPSELAIKQNSDYPQGTVDFSNICKKRREFTQVMNRILRNFPNHVFAATDLAKIRTIMGEEGMTLPCGICYVEDRRQLDTIVAQDFIDGLKLYREGSKTRPDGKPFNANQLKGLQLTDGDTYVPTIYELVSLEGRNSLKAKNPNMEAAWVRYNNARGMQSVRLLTNEAEYKRQILKYTKNTVQSKNDKGGLRIYSFSDAEMFHLIDIIQVITDSAAVGLYLQGYTKVNEYAKAVKDTGEKLNRSLIPLGDLGYHIENGKVVLDYDTVEGIDIYHEDFFDNKDNPNVGNITIGINDIQIRASMVSDFVDQIIPFHTGQSEEVLGEKGIAAWNNYKDFQTEKDLATGKTSSHQVNIYTEVIQAAEKEGKPIQNKRQFVEKFLQVCKENDLQPRFSQFLNTDAQGNYIYTEGYHKFLVDFKTFAQTEVGEYLPQGPVKPVFDNGYISGLLKAYVKEQKAKDADVAKQMPKVIERITNEIIQYSARADESNENSPAYTGEYPEGVKFQHREDNPTTLKFLNDQVERGEYTTVYKALLKIGDTYYPPMASLEKDENGRYTKLRGGQKLFDWIASDGKLTDEMKAKMKMKSPKAWLNKYADAFRKGLNPWGMYGDFNLKKADESGKSQGSVPAAYNPYQHSSDQVLNDQFEAAYDRPGLVVVECRIPNSELTDPYWAPYAKDPTGMHEWKTGPIAGQLKKTTRHVYMTRWIQPIRELSPSEVAQKIRDIVAKEDTPPRIYWNTINPKVLQELIKLGVEIDPYGSPNYLNGENVLDMYGNPITDELRAERKAEKEARDASKKTKKKPKKEQTISYSDRDSRTYTEIEEERQKLHQREIRLDERKRKAESNPELLKAMDDYSDLFTELRGLFAKKRNGTATQAELDRIEEIKRLREEALNRVAALQESLGLKEIEQERDEIRETKEALRIASDAAWAREGAERENKAIEKAGLSAPEYFRKKALKAFKTTTNFNEAGYLLPDGKLLNFSGGERNHRYRDHREIGEVYEATQGAAALNRFMADGNIRIMAESPGVDITSGIEPTKEQYEAMRKFVNSHGVKERMFFVDFSDAEGHRAGNYSYEGRVSADRVINDIKHYYATGEIREQSSLDQFLWSDRDSESVSNRSLLANAFESVAQNDIERQKIQEYKGKISLINAEEQKLSELNEQIKELSFSKGPRDTKAIRDLKFEARQTANRINTYDKQLLRLEASKPLQDVLQREKKMAYKRAEQKGKEALEAYRERTMKTQRDLLDKWQTSRKKGIDSRHRTAMRHKIKDVVNELNQYLLRGTKDRHVPIELQKAVAEALDAVNMDTVGAEERIAKLQDELLKAKTPEQIQEISRKIDHIQEMGERMNGKLQKLKDAYDQFVNSDDPLIANSHDEVISNKLQSVIETVGDTPLRDMTLTQLEDVYDMYRMVLTTIRNANKAFKAKKSESISVIANQVMMEVEKVGGKKKLAMKGMDGINSFMWNNLKPVYAFEHIGSDHFTEVFNNVRDGEDVWALDVTEAREFYLAKSKKHNYDSWDFKKRYKFTSTSGMDFELTLEQIMSLYAYSKRDQAADHLKKGGIVIDETTEITVKNKLGIPVKFNPTEATAYNISEETLADIISKLTNEQKSFADEMQDYLSTVMGAKGNEVSLVMYGVKLFKEKFYFPLKSAHQFMAKAKEQAQGDVKIKNSGFSKETVQKASNPIVLTPFMNVWANHVNEMSMYHAFVLPMEDFYRVYNYKTPTSDTMATESVEMFIQNAYGKGATKYIDQLLKDLNGGARTDSTTGIINKMTGLFKKGAVFASLSVVVQQPSAIARAAALVDTKYFIGPKVDHKRHKALWDEVKQYAPVAIIKEMGYFDTNMGKSTQDFILGKEYSGFSEKMKALVTDTGYRDEILSKAPALADELAWCSIWEAVKRETKAKYPGLDTKAEPFLKLCGSRFTEVIVKTQVYDSVLSRSALMRSKDTGMKMATAFMAEPTTSINMIADALLQGKRGNKKYARAAIGAVIASQILNSILVSFVYAGRDDDEDETYLEKYIGTLSGEILDSLNPAGYIPFIKDIMSIMQGYDVERSDMAVISDLWTAWQNLSKDNVSVYRKVEGFAGSISQIFGLPVKNIMRDARGIYQTVMSFVNGQKTTKAGIGYAVKSALPKWAGGGDVSNQNQLYEAYMSGDKDQVSRVEGRYESQTAINSAIRKALRENDPRIHEAAVARNNGNISEYTRIAKSIIAEGHFSQDNVVAAINAEINAMAKGETTASTPKASGLYKAEEFALAISQGDSAMANAIKVDIIQTAQKNGKTEEEAEKSFASSAKGDLKELYLAGSVTEDQAINALTTYCGDTQEDAEKRVGEWEFEGKYGFSWSDRADAYKSGEITAQELRDILVNVGGKTEEEAMWQVKVYDWQNEGFDIDSNQKSVVEDYETYCEPAGISKNTYFDAYLFYADSGEEGVAYSKTIECMPYIDSLPLSSSQKTALAMCWWAESTVNKYKTW